MNKVSLYFLLILVYLGLSKSFAPSEQATPYIPNEYALQHYLSGSPVSVILTDSFKTGFIIHTYFQRYLIVHVFKPPEEIYVRTSESFWSQHLEHIGMSILRRDEKTNQASTTPLPPGFLFVDDPAYGNWEYHNSGQKVWQFHNAYKGFPELFGWGDFLMTQGFYEAGLLHLENQRPYFGLEQEFGPQGSITQRAYNWAAPNEPSLKDALIEFWAAVKSSLSLDAIPVKNNNQSKKQAPSPSQKKMKNSPAAPLKSMAPQLGEQNTNKKDDVKNNQTPQPLPKLPVGEKNNE